METSRNQTSDGFLAEVTAEIIDEEESYIIFQIKAGDQEIGELDVEKLSEHLGFISGISSGDKINNGYLHLAALTIAKLMRQRDSAYSLFDEEDQPI